MRLHGQMRVGKDRESWQELECYLFAEMLICVKEKKVPDSHQYDEKRKPVRFTLKGSILIKKHLKSIDSGSDDPILTLNLSVSELPCFYLRFQSRQQLEIWHRALTNLNPVEHAPRQHNDYDYDHLGVEEEDYRTGGRIQ